jgi:type I restriction enzyme S subunit
MSTDSSTGTLPEGWEHRELGELVEISNEAGIPAVKRIMPFVGMEHVESETGKLLAYGDPSNYRSSSYIVDSKQVLYGRLRPYLNKVFIPKEKCYASREFIPMILKEELNQQFLLHRLRSSEFVEFASALNTGDRPRVKWPQMAKYSLLLPPPPEQERIVEILEEQLSRLDAALASVRAVREKAARFRRSLLHAAFSGSLSGYVSDAGVIPLGWKLEPLRKCGQWFGGGTPSKSNQKFWVDGTIPWLSPKDMGEFRIRETQDKITNDAVEQSSTKLVTGPSVAMVMRSGILERTFPVAIVEFDTTLNQDMKALVPNGDVSALWIAYALKAFEQELLDTCRKSGTTVASMETVRLLNFEIPLPEISEQLKIVEILEEQLSRLDASLAVVDEIESRAAALRRSLLHAAFTGNLTKEWRENSHV